ISSSVSNDELDLLYSKIIELGASGAKLLGAGGGGFFMVHGNSEFRDIMEVALPSNKIIPLILDFDGSTIIYNSYS
ncbi:MAG: kinase, partial [Candidatus Poseidoniales archaeon]